MFIPREIEKDIEKWLPEREMIAIIGPRQCGKTTLLSRLKERASQLGLFDERHCVLVSFDDEIECQKFERDPVDHIQRYLVDGNKHLLLLDEVQYIKDAGRKLKVVFDRLQDRAKFVITGSSGLDLRGIGASLVGRVLFFEMHPLSFSEFLLTKDPGLQRYIAEHGFDLKNPGNWGKTVPVHLDRLNRLLEEYLTFGAFPRVVLMDDIEKKKTLLRELVTTYIEKDILKIYGPAFRNDALRILQHMAFNCGGQFNAQELSSMLKLNVKKVRETVDIMENAFILKPLRPMFKSLSTEIRKMPKIYFVDIGLRNSLAEDFTFSREKGYLLESFVLGQLARRGSKLKYWRTVSKTEVDFILDDKIPIEAKSTPRITHSLMSFITQYSPPLAVLVSYEEVGRKEHGGAVVFTVPAVLL
jgi:uncharacterized protein